MVRPLEKFHLQKRGILISVLFLAACAQTPTISKYEISNSSETSITKHANSAIKQADAASSICPNEPEILRSTSKFIKLEHAMSQFEKTKQAATSWCEQYNLTADFSTQKCDKCCESNFQCR